MKPKKAAKKAFSIATRVAGAALAHHLFIRPKMLNWGATRRETRQPLPGDEFAPMHPVRSTMAITINATRHAIWPWLVQMGWNRGAFYSYDTIERLFGADLYNAERIHPEWQDLKVGDPIWMAHPRLESVLPGTRVLRIDPERALVLALMRPNGAEGDANGVWSFALEPIDEERTRLLVRVQIRRPARGAKRLAYYLFEPGHCIMQRGSLLGIKERAERRVLEQRRVERIEHIPEPVSPRAE